jgi:hypothetical protein
VILVLVDSGEAEEGGPLQGPGCCQGSGWLVEPGDAATFSDIELVNTGSEPAQIERVELLDADPRLRLEAVFAAEHEGDGYLAGSDTYPPDLDEYGEFGIAEMQPAEGYVVRPQPEATYGDGSTQGTQLFIGLRPTHFEGRMGFESVRIHYRSGVRRFVLTIPYAVTFCAPPEDRSEAHCEGRLPGE